MPEQPVRILLVEDNADHIELTLRALRNINYDRMVHVARDGVEALEFVFATEAYEGRNTLQHLRLIILDLNLPRVSGLEVLQRIKSDERTQLVPIVILTSSQQERDMRESYRLGANSYVTKPVSFGKLATAVRQVATYWVTLNELP